MGDQLWCFSGEFRRRFCIQDGVEAAPPLAAAIEAVADGLVSLHAALMVQLPATLASDAECFREAATQLEEQVGRAGSGEGSR